MPRHRRHRRRGRHVPTPWGTRSYSAMAHTHLRLLSAGALAHGLTHVIQQSRGPVTGTDHGDGVTIGDPTDNFEGEAESNAIRVFRSCGRVMRPRRTLTRPRYKVDPHGRRRPRGMAGSGFPVHEAVLRPSPGTSAVGRDRGAQGGPAPAPDRRCRTTRRRRYGSPGCSVPRVRDPGLPAPEIGLPRPAQMVGRVAVGLAARLRERRVASPLIGTAHHVWMPEPEVVGTVRTPRPAHDPPRVVPLTAAVPLRRARGGRERNRDVLGFRGALQGVGDRERSGRARGHGVGRVVGHVQVRRRDGEDDLGR